MTTQAAFEEAQGDGAGDAPLNLADEGFQVFFERVEPEAVVGQFAPLLVHHRLELALGGGRDQRFQGGVGLDQNGAGGALVVLADFEAQQAVLHDVHAAHAVVAGDLH